MYKRQGTPLEIYKSPDTPFVAQFIGHTTVVENYDRLKGFDRIETVSYTHLDVYKRQDNHHMLLLNQKGAKLYGLL